MNKRELISHLMVEHRLDIGRLPNPLLGELESIHGGLPHHSHGSFSLDTVNWPSLPAARKVAILTAMGFTPTGSSHQPDCPYTIDAGNKCNCVPPATMWAQPRDVDAHRGETYEERRDAPRQPIPEVER
jgi:hypothetical protein